MNTLVWVLLGIAIYWLGVLVLDSQGLLPSYVGTQGPILTVHTQRGKQFLNWLSGPKRFWRAWGNFGLGVALVVMAGSFLLLLVQAVAVVQNPPEATAATQPRNVLVIPGVNQFLPLSVAPEILLGLLVGLVVHEGGHGLMCRVEDIEIQSMGIAALAVLPIGAFVEPDEESRAKADRGSQSRMFAAGVTNNFAVTLVTFLLLFGPVVGSIAVAPGAAVGGVLPGSAAGDAGLSAGDRIVAVDGNAVESNEDLDATLSTIEDRSVEVTLAGGDTLTIDRSLLVTAIYPDSPFAAGDGGDRASLGKGETITAVNGTPVGTEAEFHRAVGDRVLVTVETESGETVTGPIGALATVRPDRPAAAAGMPTEGTVVVTSVGDERVRNASEFSAALDGYAPGDTVTIEAWVNGSVEPYDVTLGGEDGDAMLGVYVMQGTTGISVNGFGVQLYPAGQFLDLLGGEFGRFVGGVGGPIVSFLSGALGVLMLPFASVSLGATYNFAGFVEWNAGFYTAAGGPFSFLGEWGLFLLANALFWTGWVNLNLGFFNCIPAFPLDGGHILRTSTEAVISRLPTSQGRELTTMVTTTIGLVMLVSLLVMVFGPQLLSG
ncbi:MULTISPECIES: site-2 protease family protein [Halorussus]|uniref:site-2 protease family protein n=1 Tax=Halorussus TaxID=1070314 RepID=UPI000E214252|nr:MULTISPECIES: site-2 protease family protein [Halorussus]NHN60242.1 PDZ domain-containing protein [Halorussus sp. JP-T4]